MKKSLMLLALVGASVVSMVQADNVGDCHDQSGYIEAALQESMTYGNPNSDEVMVMLNNHVLDTPSLNQKMTGYDSIDRRQGKPTEGAAEQPSTLAQRIAGIVHRHCLRKYTNNLSNGFPACKDWANDRRDEGHFPKYTCGADK